LIGASVGTSIIVYRSESPHGKSAIPRHDKFGHRPKAGTIGAIADGEAAKPPLGGGGGGGCCCCKSIRRTHSNPRGLVTYRWCTRKYSAIAACSTWKSEFAEVVVVGVVVGGGGGIATAALSETSASSMSIVRSRCNA
jgi:hypothetical protein